MSRYSGKSLVKKTLTFHVMLSQMHKLYNNQSEYLMNLAARDHIIYMYNF